jgi:hypothetical protein
LYTDITAQGADAITAYGILKGSQASFVGFAQVYYALTRRDGTLLAAGTITTSKSASLDLNSAVLDLKPGAAT